jgi:hypothetical protein
LRSERLASFNSFVHERNYDRTAHECQA